ncbi:hypothetical protein NE237_024937 [Protea cynaroides]|uniref:Mitochondrial protein n=1 Tax=Protea cynaroides TaxID=273540 RepID=A0A9Q0JZP0_9MAGN|nr:hypothetical protein NE237_024937 [Protea cynaroides]
MCMFKRWISDSTPNPSTTNGSAQSSPNDRSWFSPILDVQTLQHDVLPTNIQVQPIVLPTVTQVHSPISVSNTSDSAPVVVQHADLPSVSQDHSPISFSTTSDSAPVMLENLPSSNTLCSPDSEISLTSPRVPQVETENPTNSNYSNSHVMITRGKSGIYKPNAKYALVSSTIPTEPTSVRAALSHEGWYAAMKEEMTALAHKKTWTLVPATSSMNIIGCR